MEKEIVWGVWDDDGPYYVLSEGRTVEEAIEVLRDQGGFDERFDIVPQNDRKPIQKEVWNCEFDGPKPCGDKRCHHNHTEFVYEFYVYEIDSNKEGE